MSDKDLNDLINSLAKEFVNNAVRQVVKAGGTYADVMILLESAIVAAMLANAKLFHLSDSVASNMAEMAVHRAMERFAAQRNKEPQK
jgi:hypothetical protein